MAIEAQRFFGGREDLIRKTQADAKQQQLQSQTMQAAQLEESRRQEAQKRIDIQQAYLREDLKELHGFDLAFAGGGEMASALNMLAKDASARMREANNPIAAQEILAGFKSQYNAIQQRETMSKDVRDQYNGAYNGTNVPKSGGQQAVRPEPSDLAATNQAWHNPFGGSEMQVVNGQVMVKGEDGQFVPMTEDPRFINTDMWQLEMQPIDTGQLDDWAKSSEVLSNIALDHPLYDESTAESIRNRAGQIYDEGLMLQNDNGYAHRDQILNYLEAQQGGSNILSPQDRERWLNGDIRNAEGNIESQFQSIVNAGRTAFQDRATWNGQYSASGSSGRSGGRGGSSTSGAYSGVVTTHQVQSGGTSDITSPDYSGSEITIRELADPIDMSSSAGNENRSITGWGVDENGALSVSITEEVGYVEVITDQGTVLRPARPNEEPTVTLPKRRVVTENDPRLTDSDRQLLEDADMTLMNLGFGDDMTNATTQARAAFDARVEQERQDALRQQQITEEMRQQADLYDQQQRVQRSFDNPTPVPQPSGSDQEAPAEEPASETTPPEPPQLTEQEVEERRASRVEYGNNAAETWLSNDPYPADRIYGIPEEERQAWWGNFPSLDALQSENMHGAAAVSFLAGLARKGVLAPEGDPRRDAVMNEYPEAYQIGLEAEAANAAELQRGVENRANQERVSNTPADGRGYPANTAPAPAEQTPPATIPQPESPREPAPPGAPIDERVVETNRQTAQAIPEVAPQASPEATEVVAQEVATANTELTPEQIAQMTPMEFAVSLIGLDEDDDHDEVEKILTQWDAIKNWYNEEGKGRDVSKGNGAWCAAFVSHVLTHTGHAESLEDVTTQGGTQEKDTFRLIRAQSFEKIGKPVELADAKTGDIVIVKSKIGYHVGFYAGKGANGKIKILGGNQDAGIGRDRGHRVTINEYSSKPDTLYAIRRPFEGSPTDTEIADISEELLATTASGGGTR